ncbi:MAG: FAD-binding oxidoreductase [bacterium]|jgi:glycolate oxidase
MVAIKRTLPEVHLTPAVLKELKGIFGERISQEDVDLVTYAYDATKKSYPPRVVVWAQTAEEISALMKLACEHRVPVYPRGGGTGLSGGALALQGGILLSLERMNRILSIDEGNRLVTAEPGIMLGTLKSEVQKRGLFYPPDPSSAKTASLGGTLAECAGGLNCVKYGTTKDWVQRVKAVLPTGEIISAGSKARKSVTGYNLLQLLIGSEGTLAVITEAVLRVIPFPNEKATFIALFDSVAQSSEAVEAMLNSGVTPSTMEFIDRPCLEAANSYIKDHTIPVVEALLLIETDGQDSRRVQEEATILAEICRQHGATSIQYASRAEEREALWYVRRNLSPAMYAKAPHKTNEDICVPIAQFPRILERAYEIGRKYNIMTLCFGHVGDGNIHVNFMTSKEFDEDVDAAVRELFQETVALGGSISGEHGIGITKAPYLSYEMGARERLLIRQIKQLFDPQNILNPGKILPETEGVV